MQLQGLGEGPPFVRIEVVEARLVVPEEALEGGLGRRRRRSPLVDAPHHLPLPREGGEQTDLIRYVR